jgi:hypothetical protein
VFSTLFVSRCYKEENWSKNSESCKGVCGEDLVGAVSRVVGYSLDSKEVSAEAGDSPLLETVTRERLVKTQKTKKTGCML